MVTYYKNDNFDRFKTCKVCYFNVNCVVARHFLIQYYNNYYTILQRVKFVCVAKYHLNMLMLTKWIIMRVVEIIYVGPKTHQLNPCQ